MPNIPRYCAIERFPRSGYRVVTHHLLASDYVVKIVIINSFQFSHVGGSAAVAPPPPAQGQPPQGMSTHPQNTATSNGGQQGNQHMVASYAL